MDATKEIEEPELKRIKTEKTDFNDVQMVAGRTFHSIDCVELFVKHDKSMSFIAVLDFLQFFCGYTRTQATSHVVNVKKRCGKTVDKNALSIFRRKCKLPGWADLQPVVTYDDCIELVRYLPLQYVRHMDRIWSSITQIFSRINDESSYIVIEANAPMIEQTPMEFQAPKVKPPIDVKSYKEDLEWCITNVKRIRELPARGANNKNANFMEQCVLNVMHAQNQRLESSQVNPTGWVYAAVCYTVPPVIKIGYTTEEDPYTRVRKLNTGAPKPYIMVDSIAVYQSIRLEQWILKELHKYDIKVGDHNRELFVMSVITTSSLFSAIKNFIMKNGEVDWANIKLPDDVVANIRNYRAPFPKEIDFSWQK
jgi:hypothetical protein